MKQFLDLLVSIRQSVQLEHTQSPTKETAYALEVCDKILVFIKSGYFTTIKDKDIILQHLHVPTKQLAQQSGKSIDAIQKAKQRIYKDLIHALSPQFLSLVKKQDWKRVDNLLTLATQRNNSDALIIQSFTKSLAQKSLTIPPVTYALKDCKREMDILYFFSHGYVEELLSDMHQEEKDKLAYLLWLLDGKIHAPLEREQLYRFLKERTLRKK